MFNSYIKCTFTLFDFLFMMEAVRIEMKLSILNTFAIQAYIIAIVPQLPSKHVSNMKQKFIHPASICRVPIRQS